MNPDNQKPLNFEPVPQDLDTAVYQEPTYVDYAAKTKKEGLQLTLWTSVAAIVVLVFIALVGYVLIKSQNKDDQVENRSQSGTSQAFNSVGLEQLNLGQISQLDINGNLRINGAAVFTPVSQPANPTTGQLYMDKDTKQIVYYDGSGYQSLTTSSNTVSSFGGATGSIAIGDGLTLQANVLSAETIASGPNTPAVTSLQGQSGAVILTGGNGISVNGTNITNTGVTSLGGATGSLPVGRGLSVSGSTLSSTISLVSGSGTLVVNDDGNGNYTITQVGSGSAGSVALGPTVAQTDASNFPSIDIDKTGSGDLVSFSVNGVDRFIVNQSGAITTGSIAFSQLTGTPQIVNNVTDGSLNTATGALTLGTGLALSGNTINATGSGISAVNGTANQVNASTVAGVVSLSLPQDINTNSTPTFSGLNLTGLSNGIVQSSSGSLSSGAVDRNSGTLFTSNLSVANGGTGANNASSARTNLGAAGSGANNDITSLSGLTTALSVGQGGTGATTLGSNGVLLGNGTGAISSLVSGASGLCLTSTVGAPTWAACPGSGGVSSVNTFSGAVTIQGTANQVSVANNTGTITLSLPQDINTSSSPQFSGLNLSSNLTVQGGTITVGSNSQQGVTVMYDGSSNTGTLQTAALGQNTVYTLPDPGGASTTICLNTGNCAGTGGGVTTSGGTNNTIAKFTGSQTLGNSSLTDDGTTVTIGVNFNVSGLVTLSTALGVASGGTGATSLGANGVLLGNGTSAVSSLVAGASGLCLTSTAGAPIWAACPGSGGVSSVNTFSGAVTIQGTINQVNVANNTGTVTLSTPQDINTSSSPQFSALTLTSNLAVQGGTATLGTSSQAGSLVVYDGSSNTGTLQTAALGQNTVYTLPDPGGASANICLSTGNCAGSGGGVTTSGGTTNRISKFTGAQTLGDSTLTDNGSVVSTTGDLAVNGGDIYSSAATLTINAGGTVDIQDGVVVDSLTADTGNVAITSGDLQTAGVIRLTNAGVLQNVTNADASTFFTGGSLSVARGGTGAGSFTTNGIIYGNGTSALGVTAAGSTGQCLIATTGSAPSWGSCAGGGSGVTLQAAYANSTGGTTPEIKLDSTRTGLDIQDADTTLGGSLFTVRGSNNTGLGSVLFDVTSSGNITVSGTAVVAGASITVGTVSQSGSLIIYDGSNNTGTVQAAALGQNTVYNLPDPGVGSVSICLSTGNCAGSGSGVTTAGGTNNTIPKFTGSQTLGNSQITDDGTLVTIGGGSGTFSLQTSNIDISSAGAISGVTGYGQTSGDFSYNNASGNFSINSSAFDVSTAGIVSGVTGYTQSSGAFALSGAGNFSIDSSNFDVTTGGAVSGVTGYAQASGNFLQSGTGTFGTGTGVVSLNGATSVTGTNTFTVGTGLASFGGNVNISNAGSLATLRGADYTTAGSANNVALSTASLYRLDTSGAAQTITGIVAGRDGQLLTLVNADASLAVTLSNLSGSSSAANQISTGTGVDISLAAGASISLIYDAGSSLWRVNGGVAGGNGTCSTCANASLSNLASVAINTALLPGADNTIDLGSSSFSFRTLYADTSVLAPSIDVATAGTLALGNSTATGVSICNSAACDALTLANNADADTVTIGDSLDTIGINGSTTVTGTTVINGVATINSNVNNATNINTGTNNALVTIGGGSGTFSLQTTNIDISSAGAISGVTGYGQTSGDFSYNNASGNFSIDSAGLDVTTGGSVSGVTGYAQSSGTFAFNGAGNFSIDSSNFDVTSGGAISGVTGYAQASGNFLQSGTGTFGTGTGAVSLNGATSVTGTNTFSVGTGLASFGGNVNVSNAGSLATLRGADYTTAGSANNVALNVASLYRLDTSGAAQTITGIAAGRDGQILTLVNADASLPVTLSNLSASSSAANQISTGTNADVLLASGGSISLIYDSGASLWRVLGGVAGGNGVCTTCANASLSNLASVAINTALLPGADNTIDLGSSSFSFRTLYADTSVLSPSVDVATAGTLALGDSTATAVSICNSTACDSLSLASNADADTITIGDSLDAVGINGSTTITGTTAVNGVTTINNNLNNATNINTGTNNALVTIGGGSGTFSLQTSNIDISSAGAISGVTGYGQTSGDFSYNNASGNFSINSSAFDVSTAGIVSGVTGYTQSSGAFALSGAGNFSIDSSNFDVTTGGAVSGVTGYAQSSGAFSFQGNAASTLTTSTGNITIDATSGSATVGIGSGAQAKTIQIGSTSGAVAQTINIGNNATAASTTAVVIGSTIAGTTTLQSQGGVGVTTLGSATANSAYLCRDTSTALLTSCNTTGASGVAFMQGGNSFGQLAVLGTNDTNSLTIRTNSTSRATFDQSNNLYLGNANISGQAAAPNSFTIQGTSASAAATAGGDLTVRAGNGNTSGNGGNLILQGGSSASGTGGGVIVRSQTNSTTSFRVQNAGGTNTLLNVDATIGRTTITNTDTGVALALTNSNNSGTVTLNAYDGALEIGSGNDSGSYLDFKGSSNLATDYQGRISYDDGQGFAFRTNASANNAFTIATNGSAVFKNYTDTTSAFQIQGSASLTPILNADTTNSRISIGDQGADTGQLYVGGHLVTSAVGTLTTAGGLGFGTDAIEVRGKYAYVVNYDSNEFNVIDVSNPASPAEVSTLAIGSGPEAVAVNGNYAYVVTTGTPGSIQVIDVTNPANPSIAGSTNVGNNPYRIVLNGSYAYVLNETSSSISVVDVLNPASPSIKSTYTTGLNEPKDAYIQGKYLYVANNNGQTLVSINISNPASLVSMGSVALGANALALAVSGKYAYVTDEVTSVHVIDISNPSSMSQLGTYFADADVQELRIQGRYMYGVSNQAATSKLYTYDLSNPAVPSAVANIPTGTSPYHLSVQGRYAYVTLYDNDTLNIFDLGGAYVQQLETGGIQSTTINVQDISIINNTTIGGSLTVSNLTSLEGGLTVSGTSTFRGDLLASAAPTGSSGSIVATEHTTTNSDGGLKTAIGIPSDNLPAIAHYDLTLLDLAFTKCSNVTCSSSTTTSIDAGTSGNVGQYPALAIGTDGYPVIAHHDSNTGSGALRVTKCNDQACTDASNTDTTVDDNDNTNANGATADDIGDDQKGIAIGTDGFPVISYWDATNNDLRFVKCGNAACSSGNTTRLLVATGNVGINSSIAIASDGFPIIAFSDSTNTALNVYKCNDASCSSGSNYQVDNTGDQGGYPSIAIGHDGYPIIAYQDITNTNLKTLKCNSASCTTSSSYTITSHSTTSSAEYASVVIGADGNPLIAYYEPGASDDLEVFKCTNASCTAAVNTVLETSNDVGAGASVKLGSDGYPIIAHTNQTSNNVRTYHCGDYDCEGTGTTYSGGSNIGSSTNYFNSVYANQYYGKSFSIANFDLAEEYTVEDTSLTSGEIVAINPATGKLKRASLSERQNIFGIVSTNPGLALKDYEANRSDTKMIALVGRVPMKVKGPIVAGDPITVSSEDGIGIKATTPGMIVGKAMETTLTDATIQVFVQTESYLPSFEQGGQNLVQFQNISVSGTATIGTLVVTGNATFNGDITVAGHIITSGDVPSISVASGISLMLGAQNPIVAVDGNDTSGTITITTGSLGMIGQGDLARITFDRSYAKVPRVLISAVGSDSSRLAPYVNQSQNEFTFGVGNAPSNSKTYKFNYMIME